MVEDNVVVVVLVLVAVAMPFTKSRCDFEKEGMLVHHSQPAGTKRIETEL